MINNNVKVIKAGLCTSVQDLGRFGYLKFAMPVTGYMDEFAASAANYLVGNKRKDALLEVTYLGPTLEFQEEMLIGITGANLNPKINNLPVDTWRSFHVKKGDILSFGKVSSGVRAYIAFGGSIRVPSVLGSRSTYAKYNIGGFQGRILQDGDAFSIHVRKKYKPQKINENYIPNYPHKLTVHVCLGSQADYFTEEGMKAFFSNSYAITPNTDRSGLKLEGKAISHKKEKEIIPDSCVLGSIQIDENGQPIILTADCQTTGKYPKIGTIIKEDLVKIAQLGIQDTIEFRPISIEEAQDKYHDFYKKVKEVHFNLQDIIEEDENTSAIIDSILPILLEGENAMLRKFKVSIDGRVHVVEVEEIGANSNIVANTTTETPNVTNSQIAKEKVKVPVAGVITKLAVKVGDTVKEGDLLFSFEAMKMENEALSSCEGTVGIIYKNIGDAISTEDIVLEIF